MNLTTWMNHNEFNHISNLINLGKWYISLLTLWIRTPGNNHNGMFDLVAKQRCSQVNTGCRQPRISFPFCLTRCGLEVWGVLLEYMLCPYLASPSSSNLSFGSQQAAAPILPFPQDLCSTEDNPDWILGTSSRPTLLHVANTQVSGIWWEI